jgi:hypothetical protein
MLTPGEISVGTLFTIIDGKPIIDDQPWAESDPFPSFFYFRREPVEPTGIARVFVTQAINLPMILAVDLVHAKPVVIDTRKVTLREITKEYAQEYRRLFLGKRPKGKKPGNPTADF